MSSRLWNWPWLRTQERGVALVDLAERRVLVLLPQRLDDLVHRQVERGDLLLRQLDVDLPAQAAVDGDRRHAVHALEARRELVLRHLAQRHRVEVALDAELHDRQRVRVELEDGGRVGVLGQAVAHAVDARADFVGGLRQVRAPVEVEAHLAVAFRRRGFDPRQARHGADGLLDRPRDQLLHLERADAGVAGAHRERAAARTPASGRPAGGVSEITPEQRDDAADHEHRDGPLNRETRNAHVGYPVWTVSCSKAGLCTTMPATRLPAARRAVRGRRSRPRVRCRSRGRPRAPPVARAAAGRAPASVPPAPAPRARRRRRGRSRAPGAAAPSAGARARAAAAAACRPAAAPSRRPPPPRRRRPPPGSTMRSPSRSAAAPVVMTASPSVEAAEHLDEVRLLGARSASARKTADSLSGVNTPRRPPRSTTALAGTTSASFLRARW